MLRTLLPAFLAVFLVLAAPAQAPRSNTQPAGETAQTAPTPFETAQSLAAKGRLAQALAMLDALAAQTPEPAGVERLRGMIFYQKDQLGEAAKALAGAVSQDATDREAVEMLGVTLYRLGRPQDAIPLLEAADLAPVKEANLEPKYVLGLCYSDVKRYDDARRAFAAQYGFQPDSPESHLLAARLFLRRELVAEAAGEAGKALALNPTLPLAHQLLGEAALARGDLPAAIRELEAERTLNPLNGVLYDRLGDAYLRNGQWDDARQALDRAVLLEPSATGPYILLGETFLNLNQPIQALHYLDRAENMDPSNYITHNLLGKAYKATGQLAEANREFKTVVDIQRQNNPKPAGK